MLGGGLLLAALSRVGSDEVLADVRQSANIQTNLALNLLQVGLALVSDGCASPQH